MSSLMLMTEIYHVTVNVNNIVPIQRYAAVSFSFLAHSFRE